MLCKKGLSTEAQYLKSLPPKNLTEKSFYSHNTVVDLSFFTTVSSYEKKLCYSNKKRQEESFKK